MELTILGLLLIAPCAISFIGYRKRIAEFEKDKEFYKLSYNWSERHIKYSSTQGLWTTVQGLCTLGPGTLRLASPQFIIYAGISLLACGHRQLACLHICGHLAMYHGFLPEIYDQRPTHHNMHARATCARQGSLAGTDVNR